MSTHPELQAKRGARPKDELDRLRTKLWCSVVTWILDMSPAEAERALHPEVCRFTFKWIQPHAFTGYAAATRLPLDVKAGDIVPRVEVVLPGTAGWIRSIAWDVLRSEHQAKHETDGMLLRLPASLWPYVCEGPQVRGQFSRRPWSPPDPPAYTRFACFHVFGILLAFAREDFEYKPYGNSHYAYLARAWLRRMYLQFPPIRKHWSEFTAILQDRANYLGDVESILLEEQPQWNAHRAWDLTWDGSIEDPEPFIANCTIYPFTAEATTWAVPAAEVGQEARRASTQAREAAPPPTANECESSGP